MNDKKMFRVAAINSPTQIVINAGRAKGVKLGARFQIFGLGPMVKDPETGEPLEAAQLLRGTGEVIQVQEKISIINADSPGLASMYAVLFQSSSIVAPSAISGVSTSPRANISGFDKVQIGDYAYLLS